MLIERFWLLTELTLPNPSSSTNRTANPRPSGGAAIPVTATVSPQQFPLATVELVYVVGYGQEVAVPMAGGKEPCWADSFSARAGPAGAAPCPALQFVLPVEGAGFPALLDSCSM
jgi:hypothetical protein